MSFEPPGQRRQPGGSHPVDTPTSFGDRDHELRRLQRLQMLHDRRARNRQTGGKLSCGLRSSSNPLENDDTQRMTEQREQPQHLAKLCRIGVRFCHRRSVMRG